MFWIKFILVESWKIMLNFSTFPVGGYWGQLMLLFWKLVDETQMPTNPKAASNYHSSIKFPILLPLRVTYNHSFTDMDFPSSHEIYRVALIDLIIFHMKNKIFSVCHHTLLYCKHLQWKKDCIVFIVLLLSCGLTNNYYDPFTAQLISLLLAWEYYSYLF